MNGEPKGSPMVFGDKWEVVEELYKLEGTTLYLVKCKDGKEEESFAIKVLDIEGLSEDRVVRFKNEANVLLLLKEMNHPNIIRIFDTNIDKSKTVKQLYYVMEYAAYGSLGDCPISSLDFIGKMNLFLQICEGVLICHELGIVHRDLKPDNIVFVDPLVNPKISDFGIALDLRKRSQVKLQAKLQTKLTLIGQFLGTPPWMHPDQASNPSGEGIDARKFDVHELGKILIFLLTGEVFVGNRIKMSDLGNSVPVGLRRKVTTLINSMIAIPVNRIRLSVPQVKGEIWRIMRRYCDLQLPRAPQPKPSEGSQDRYITNKKELWRLMNSMVDDVNSGDRIWGTASLPNEDSFEENIKQKLSKIEQGGIQYTRCVCFDNTDLKTKGWFDKKNVNDEEFLKLRHEGKFTLRRIKHHLGMDIFVIRYQKVGRYVGLLLFPVVRTQKGWEFASGYFTYNQPFLFNLTTFFDEYLRYESEKDKKGKA